MIRAARRARARGWKWRHNVLNRVGFPLLALAIGGLGGGLAGGAGLTGGWLFGSLLAVYLASSLGLPLGLPSGVRSVALGYAGLVVGAAIHRDTLQSAALLPGSLAAMAGLLVAVVTLGVWLHRRYWGASKATAIACAWPGNLLLALAGAEAIRADMDRVAVVQLARLLALMVVLPLAVGSGAAAGTGEALPVTWDLLAAAAVTLACILAARRLRLPGGEMFLAAIAVGLLVSLDAIQLEVPRAINDFFQVVVGAFVGLSLAKCRRGALGSALAPALLGALAAAVLTLAVALPMALLLDYPPVALALAYAPGGAEAMILLSTVFGVDAGFVGIHHTLRLIALTLLFPLVARRFLPRPHQATGSR